MVWWSQMRAIEHSNLRYPPTLLQHTKEGLKGGMSEDQDP